MIVLVCFNGEWYGLVNVKFFVIYDDFVVVGVNDIGWCFDIIVLRSKEKIVGREISGGEDVKILFSFIFVDEC